MNIFKKETEQEKLLSDARCLGDGKGATALVRIAKEELWQGYHDAKKESFKSFCDFVLGQGGDGLELSTVDQIDLLRLVLLNAELHHIWAPVLVCIAIPPGRRSNRTGGPNLFYTPTPGGGSVDRILLRLHREHNDEFQQFVTGDKTYEEVAKLVTPTKARKPVLERIRAALDEIGAHDREMVLRGLLDSLDAITLTWMQQEVGRLLNK